MRLTIVDSDETEDKKDELCCEDFNEMRNHVSRVLSNWFDTIVSSDDEIDEFFSQRMHFRYVFKGRLNWYKNETIEKIHETMMDRDFMIKNIENNDEMKVKMEAATDYDNIDHTVCVFINTLQEITIMKQQEQIDKLIGYIEKMK